MLFKSMVNAILFRLFFCLTPLCEIYETFIMFFGTNYMSSLVVKITFVPYDNDLPAMSWLYFFQKCHSANA